MDKTKEIKLECIFCSSTNFDLPSKDYQPSEDENIKCSNCGKLNIYSDLLEITKAKGLQEIKEEFTKEIETKFKNMFK
ncbi:MAG: hypothetical protein DRG78_17145 [Epsilonproteobacteria bacterium]|nr:MAG: hypothetical protein DRG78_17145 [Campylobacterota bacterium]